MMRNHAKAILWTYPWVVNLRYRTPLVRTVLVGIESKMSLQLIPSLLPLGGTLTGLRNQETITYIWCLSRKCIISSTNTKKILNEHDGGGDYNFL